MYIRTLIIISIVVQSSCLYQPKPQGSTSFKAHADTTDTALSNQVPEIEILDESISAHFGAKMVLHKSDTILDYHQIQGKDSLSNAWRIPLKDELLDVFKNFYEIDGRTWNVCYGDWTSGAKGTMIFQSQKSTYRLDAGGWVIIVSGKKPRYFGCKKNDCENLFPSECFCDEE